MDNQIGHCQWWTKETFHGEATPSCSRSHASFSENTNLFLSEPPISLQHPHTLTFPLPCWEFLASTVPPFLLPLLFRLFKYFYNNFVPFLHNIVFCLSLEWETDRLGFESLCELCIIFSIVFHLDSSFQGLLAKPQDAREIGYVFFPLVSFTTLSSFPCGFHIQFHVVGYQTFPKVDMHCTLVLNSKCDLIFALLSYSIILFHLQIPLIGLSNFCQSRYALHITLLFHLQIPLIGLLHLTNNIKQLEMGKSNYLWLLWKTSIWLNICYTCKLWTN